MKKTFSLIAMLGGFVLSAGVYANDTGPANTKPAGLQAVPVRATVMSNTLDTVRLFVPDGNEVICKGESIPVYRIESGMKGMLSSKDLSGLELVGEVRVDNRVGESYAQGSLITGEADPGDMAIKPDRSCLKG